MNTSHYYRVVSLLRYLIRFYRVYDWIHIIGLSILGFFYVSCIPPDYYPLSLCILLSSLYLAFGYSFNSIFEEYTKQKKLSHLVIFSILPALMSLSIAYLLSTYLLGVLFIGIVLGVMYSAPPIMIKSHPIFELFVNSALFVVLFLAGVILGGGFITRDIVLLSLFILIIIIPLQLVQELKDKREDDVLGLKTTVLSTSLSNIKAIMLFSTIGVMLMSFLMPLKSKLSPVFTIITVIFCIFILSQIKSLSEGNEPQYTKSRVSLRKASIVYGISLFFVFVFFNGGLRTC